MMKSLGLTDLFILGLLKQKAMYGYEIKQFVEIGHTADWAKITQSSIYHSLRKLEGKGLVTKTAHQDGHLEQRIFELTEQGLETFTRLTEDCLSRVDDLYPEYSIALMFTNELDNERLVNALLKRRQYLVERIEYTEDCLNKTGARTDVGKLWPGEKRIVAGRNLKFYKAEFEFIEELLQEFQK